MSLGISCSLKAFCAPRSTNSSHEEQGRKAHRDYARVYSGWIHSLEEQAEAGNASARADLDELKALSDGKKGDENLLRPLKYEEGSARRYGDNEDDAPDPADRAVDPLDPRIPIVDFESATQSELQSFCDQFRAALVWATRGNNGSQPDLMQMGARMLTIFGVMAPQLKIGMDLRIPRNMESNLRAIVGHDPIAIGKFFRRPLAWVRKCTSLVQLGKRGYSMTYVLCGDLINSATCAAIGDLDNKSRQAANKPIQDFRDTFGGIKSLPMRGKETRKRCKRSQEKR